MLNFDYSNKTRIVFGKGTETQVGSLVKPYAEKVLLHYGGGSIKKSGLYDRVAASLRESGVSFVELGGVQPNPRLSLIHQGIELCRREGIGFILAVGGGSVIDSAKAIAMGVPYDGDVWDFFATGKPIETALPVATILTLPATGSEASDGTVVTNEEAQLKLPYGDVILRPVFSIMNPELYFTLPENQVANGVCDMMSHIMERYFTNTTHTDVTDGLCESVLRTIMSNARILKRDHTNYDAWAEIALAGTVAHNGLLGLGREEDWGCHNMEHELSAIYDVAHGAGLAVVTPAWMPENQVANGVCDMMSHIMERYFTNTTHTDVTDGLCESVLRTIMSNARILKRDHTNYDAWAEIALAGTVAHNGLLGLGREEDWGCHNMEHELSAIYDVAHGAGLAVVTPAWMRHIYKEHLPIFVQFAVNVMGVGGGLRDLEAVALEGIRRLQAFFTEMGQPSTLAGLGIDSRHLAQMAYKATHWPDGSPKPLGGLKKLSEQDALAIYQLAL